MAVDASQHETPISGITCEESVPGSVRDLDDRAESGREQTRTPTRVRERGETIGRYVVVDTIGRGGMGVVYAAWDPQLDRKIALKLVMLGGNERDSQADTQRIRLLREAQALGRLVHPHVVQVHDVGECDGQVFIAMEFVEGESLRDWLRRRRRSTRAILRVFRAAAQGLAAAHAAGLIHRDFKPDNVLVGEGELVKVVDFGLARDARAEGGDRPRSRVWAQTEPKIAAALEAASEALTSDAPITRPHEPSSNVVLDSESHDSSPASHSSRPRSGGTTDNITLAGTILGTPAYMAPEQHQGERVDARSDQYAFCVALWEAVYGRRPFSGRKTKELARRKQSVELRESSRGIPVPRWLRQLMLRGLAVEPERRFPDMNALVAELDRGLAPRHQLWLPWAALALVGLIVLGFWLKPHEPVAGLCAPPTEALVGVWDRDRRLEVERALRASRAVYADDTWARVRDVLDAYRVQWLDAQVSGCRAVHVERTREPAWLEQQLTCLEDRRRELASLTSLLARSDGRTVEHAARAARSLVPVEVCARAPEDGEQTPLPTDPHQRLRVERQLDLLADAKVQLSAGHLREGLDGARAVRERAREIGWPALEAEALYVIGGRSFDLDQRLDRANETLHEAARQALKGQHHLLAVHAWNLLARNLVRAGEFDEAERWIDYASELERELTRTRGESPRLAADSAHARSQWLFHQGKFAEAEAEARRRRELLASFHGDDSPQVADALNAIGVAVYMQHRKDEAVELYREALAILERVNGEEHPAVATMHNNIGVVLTDKQRWAEAELHYLRASTIRLKVYPERHELVIQSLSNLANLYLFASEPERAIDPAERVVEGVEDWMAELVLERRASGVSEGELAEQRLELVPHLLRLGQAYRRAGRHRQAQAVLERALALLDAVPGIRLPPDLVLTPEGWRRRDAEGRVGSEAIDAPAHLEGCRVDTLAELEAATRAKGELDRAEQLGQAIREAPLGPSYLRRCTDELGGWIESRRSQ